MYMLAGCAGAVHAPQEEERRQREEAMRKQQEMEMQRTAAGSGQASAFKLWLEVGAG